MSGISVEILLFYLGKLLLSSIEDGQRLATSATDKTVTYDGVVCNEANLRVNTKLLRIAVMQSGFNKLVHDRYSVRLYRSTWSMDWEEACELLTKKGDSVPYVWDGLLAMLRKKPQTLDALVNRIESQPKPSEARLW